MLPACVSVVDCLTLYVVTKHIRNDHLFCENFKITVAIDLGYDSPSAFLSMFKKALGKTPGRYFVE